MRKFHKIIITVFLVIALVLVIFFGLEINQKKVKSGSDANILLDNSRDYISQNLSTSSTKEKDVKQIIATLPPDKKNLAKSIEAFAARGKRIDLVQIADFEEIAVEINSGNYTRISSLIKSKESLNNLRAANGQNLLMFALGSGASAQTIQLLIKSGIDVNAVDDQGKTAAHLILGWGGPSKEMMQILSENGANFSIKDKSGVSVNDILKVRR